MIFENEKGFWCLFVDVTQIVSSGFYHKRVANKWRLMQTGNGFDLPLIIDLRFKTKKQTIKFMKMFGFKK